MSTGESESRKKEQPKELIKQEEEKKQEFDRLESEFHVLEE